MNMKKKQSGLASHLLGFFNIDFNSSFRPPFMFCDPTEGQSPKINDKKASKLTKKNKYIKILVVIID